MGFLFSHVRPVVTIGEVSLALQITSEQVRSHIEEQNFYAAPINDAQPNARKREHMRIMRFSVEAWWILGLQDKAQPVPPITITAEHVWWIEQLKAKRRLMSSSKI